MNFRKWFVLSLVASFCLLAIRPAAAHGDPNSHSDGALILFGLSPLTSATSTLGTTVGGGVTLAILLINAGNDNDSSEEKEEFVRKYAFALQQDITLGGGPSIRDLAVAYRVDRDDYDAFAEVLNQHRSTLVPLTDRRKLNRERANRFFQTVTAAMWMHPKLRNDVRELTLASR